MSTLTLPAVRSPRLVAIGEAAKLANVHPDTIRYYMERGQIDGMTTPGGHRRVSLESVADCFGVALPSDSESEQAGDSEHTGRAVHIMARVSSKKQEIAGDLGRQVADLQRYAGEHYPAQRVRVLKGVGSGLNDSRPEFRASSTISLPTKCPWCCVPTANASPALV